MAFADDLSDAPLNEPVLATVLIAQDGSLTNLTQTLKAAGEETRLRILSLLAAGERSVKDLTDILSQSQPRISRHLKLLLEAGLIERHREGTWAFFRLSDGQGGSLARSLVSRLDANDPVIARDRVRLDTVRSSNGQVAAEYFAEHAAEWDSIRSLHADDAEIEAAMLALAPASMDLMVDLGTGTARMLELFSRKYRRAIGIDQSPDMLAYARNRLDRAGLSAAQVRRGDMLDLGSELRGADFVVMHQVLHFLDDPAAAIRGAIDILVPGGMLMIVDFKPHELEFLRTEQAHRRLGFSTAQLSGWISEAGGKLTGSVSIGAPARSPDRRLSVGLWTGQVAGGEVRP
ncbi:ArsR/SmtB family transcription factor [Tepidamorphus sp. 3E244]|uniref:ArsR/SmtB family transcription factor n=1 Tax=Tepidamorphus sp. 3E244 TaxID=3385498 RepID=UPI0038FCF4F6